MLKNYLKIAWRNILKNKVYAIINVTGLAAGLAACILIALFVLYEKSFDSIHTKNLYRLNEVQDFEGMVAPQNVALSMFPMGPTLTDEFPEVLNFVRINGYQKVGVTFEDKSVFIPLYQTDSTFLDLFEFDLIQGSRETLLDDPYGIVLTNKVAYSLFGDEDPVGKSLNIGGEDIAYQVRGIMDDVPENSHLQFEALITFDPRNSAQNMSRWGNNWLVTYLELTPGTDIKQLEKQFPEYLARHMDEVYANSYTLFLQPLADVHGGSVNITHDYLNYQKFDQSLVKMFAIIALIVLLTASINFMNLSLAQSIDRSKEVGIRKSIGANKLQLIRQFLGEAALLVIAAEIIAIAVVYLALPYVRNLSQRNLQLSFEEPGLLLSIIGTTSIVGVLTCFYPAFYLSSFNPANILKGLLSKGKPRSSFRNSLVVIQFSSAAFLILSTFLVVRQLNFMTTKNPGFNSEQVITIPLSRPSSQKFSLMKEELLQSSLVKGVTACQQGLGNNLHQSGVTYQGKGGPARNLTSSRTVVDPEYLDLYEIQMVAGRNFSTDPTENGKTVIINETLANELLKFGDDPNIESLMGSRFGFQGMDELPTIIGISEDFNFNTLHHKIETLFIYSQLNYGFNEMSVKIDGKNIQESLSFVKSVWNENVIEIPFEYNFLDDHFAQLYRSDQQVKEVVSILAGLAIIISCLGLFGLASFSTEKRMKEIGIRKVLGSSVFGVVQVLSREFTKLVLIAILIVVPLGYFIANRWLENFAYHIDLTWWYFAGAGMITLIIAWLTVGVQTIRAARANPSEVLRSE